jgi:pre-mRNA 3'-end-processing factor FIP1
MDVVDDDDDLYAPEEYDLASISQQQAEPNARPDGKLEQEDEDLEEGEEEDEAGSDGSDSVRSDRRVILH